MNTEGTLILTRQDIAALMNFPDYVGAVEAAFRLYAVDAWASAPDAEKAARFASAEAIRWLGWGVRSYQSSLLGVTFVLFAIVIVWTARTSRAIGVLMGLSAWPTWRRAG
jgi:hypothetical protein